MKTNQLMLVAACTVMLLACNKNEKSVETPTDPVVLKAAAAKDSIKKAEAAELELFRQDSIESSKIKSYTVKKISGKQKYSGEKTSIKYNSFNQEIKSIKERADKEMWTKEKLESTITELKQLSIGGTIQLDIERLTIASANTEYFSVIVKDSNDTEIYREDLKNSIPNTPSGSENWWNIATVFVPKRIKAPFYIYVVDKLDGTPFKYQVTAVNK